MRMEKIKIRIGTVVLLLLSFSVKLNGKGACSCDSKNFLAVFDKKIAVGIEKEKGLKDAFQKALLTWTSKDTTAAISEFVKLANDESVKACIRQEAYVSAYFLSLLQGKCDISVINAEGVLTELPNDELNVDIALAFYYIYEYSDASYYKYYRKKVIHVNTPESISKSLAFLFDWLDIELGIQTQFNFKYSKAYSGFLNAVRSLSNGDYESALASINTALKMEPNNLRFLQKKVEIHQLSNRFAENEPLFERMLELVDRYPDVKSELYTSQVNNKALYGGRPYSEVLTSAYSSKKEEELLNKLISYSEAQNDTAGGISYLRVRAEDYPSVENKSDYIFARYYIRRKFRKGKEELMKLYRQNKSPYIIHKVLSCVAVSDQDSLEQYTHRFLADHPNNIELLILEARRYLSKNDHEKFQQSLFKVMELDCCNFEALTLFYTYIKDYDDVNYFLEEVFPKFDKCHLGTYNEFHKLVLNDCFQFGKKEPLISLLGKYEEDFFKYASNAEDFILNMLFLLENKEYVRAEGYLEYIKSNQLIYYTIHKDFFLKVNLALLLAMDQETELSKFLSENQVQADWIKFNDKPAIEKGGSSIRISLLGDGRFLLEIEPSAKYSSKLLDYLKGDVKNKPRD